MLHSIQSLLQGCFVDRQPLVKIECVRIELPCQCDVTHAFAAHVEFIHLGQVVSARESQCGESFWGNL